MEQYIKKSALVAEIERRISLFKKEKKTEKWSAAASQMNVISLGVKIAMLEEILSFINTIEVKEVDLWTELGNYIEHYRNIETGYTMLGIAEHFFELGLKAQKGE